MTYLAKMSIIKASKNKGQKRCLCNFLKSKLIEAITSPLKYRLCEVNFSSPESNVRNFHSGVKLRHVDFQVSSTKL